VSDQIFWEIDFFWEFDVEALYLVVLSVIWVEE